MTNGPQASAGWYPDAQGELRYWDGAAWTDYTASNYPYTRAPGRAAASGATVHARGAKPSKPWSRRWQVWLVAACVGFLGIGAIGEATTPDATDDTTVKPAAAPALDRVVDETASSTAPAPTPVAKPKPTVEPVVLLLVTDQKDGDSWVASDGKEYRLGLVNTPERGEQCASEATAFTRKFLRDGFTANTYASDGHGRAVAEIRDKAGRSLNVKIAKSGLADGRYLEQFRHENPDLGRRLDRALASASRPGCKKAAEPVPFVQPPPKKEAPSDNCMSGYSPCLPIVGDLDCGEIGHPVRVTGSDPYRLDADGDGTGCD